MLKVQRKGLNNLFLSFFPRGPNFIAVSFISRLLVAEAKVERRDVVALARGTVNLNAI